MKKTLNICYYYKPEGDFDAFTFVGECSERGAIKYAKYAFGFKLKAEDIDGVYLLDREDDDKGNYYIISITKK